MKLTATNSDKILTRNQARAIEVLLLGFSRQAAADHANVSRHTLWRWLQDDAFLQAMRDQSESVFSASKAQLLAISNQCVETVAESLDLLMKQARDGDSKAASAAFTSALEFLQSLGLLDKAAQLSLNATVEHQATDGVRIYLPDNARHDCSRDLTVIGGEHDNGNNTDGPAGAGW